MKRLILVLVALASFSVQAGGQFDLSPDGKTAAAIGGYNRVLYIVDVENSIVNKRLNIPVEGVGADNKNVAFSNDGTKLWCSYYSNLYCFETSTWTQVKLIEKISKTQVSFDKNKLIYKAGWGDSFVVLDMNTGEEVSKIEIKESSKINLMSISNSDNSVFVIFRNETDESESSSIDKDKLKEMSGAQKATTFQKNDGKKARFQKLNLMTGEVIYDEYSWFSEFGRGELFSNSGAYYMLGYKGSFKLDEKNKLSVLDIESQVSMDFSPTFSEIIPVKFYGLSGYYNLIKDKFTEQKFNQEMDAPASVYINGVIYCFEKYEIKTFDMKGEKINSMRVM